MVPNSLKKGTSLVGGRTLDFKHPTCAAVAFDKNHLDWLQGGGNENELSWIVKLDDF